MLDCGGSARDGSVLCVGCANVEEAVVLAVNHSGDSDSTGAVAGNICGALFGAETILARWADFVELHDEITAMADDLAAQRGKAGRDHRSPLEPVSGLVTQACMSSG